MTIPFREFALFDERSIRAEDPDSHNYNQISDWDTTQYPNRRRLGEYRYPAGNHYEKEHPLIRLRDGFQQLVPAGLEKMVNFELSVSFSQEAWTAGGAEAYYISSALFIKTTAGGNTENSTVNWENFSGRYKDKNGSVVWDGVIRAIAGPERISAGLIDTLRLFPGDTFIDFTFRNRSYAGGTIFPDYSDELTNIYGGMWPHQTPQYLVGPTWFSYTWQQDEGVWYIMTPKLMKVRYYNPITNSISKMVWSKDGGTTVILKGSNFHISDADLNETAQPAVLWDFYVHEIKIIGLQGQGTTTLTTFAGDFVVDNEGQITIAATPSLTPGTYELLIENRDHTVWIALSSEQYAGDWRTDAYKRITPGVRFEILVRASEEAGDGEDGGGLLLTEWTWKDADGNTITEFIGPIDIRSDKVFYHGRLLSYSGYSREVNDKSGMFSVSDMSIELINNDKRYSTLLANYFLKGQYVGIYHAWKNEPESWKSSLIKMVVDDYELDGAIFRVSLKDVSNKYFLVNIPRYVVNDTDYPSAPESSLGRPIPEALGLNYLTGATPGAIEAIKVEDKKYVAAAASLHSVTQVYSEGVLQTVAVHYTISYEDGGRTYINFVSAQGEKKVTFNCTGYTYEAWNSINGYVQNPAYIVEFIIAFILEVPISRVHTASFDDLAALYATLNFDTSGRWVGQEAQTGESIIQELMISYGSKLFQDNEGRFKLDRKDLSDLSADVRIFDQIHNLRPAVRKFNLNEAFNLLKANFDFYPTASLFKGIMELRNQTSIDNFESEIEPDFMLDLRWLDSELFANYRTIEELIKYSEGYLTAEFLWPSSLIGEIDIMTTFLFQDPFGIDAAGAGEEGRYYYIVSIRPDFVNNTLEISAVDLTWLAQQQSGSGSG